MFVWYNTILSISLRASLVKIIISNILFDEVEWPQVAVLSSQFMDHSERTQERPRTSVSILKLNPWSSGH